MPLAACASVFIKPQGAHPYSLRLPTVYHVEVKHLIPAFLHLLASRAGLGSLALAGSAAAVPPDLSFGVTAFVCRRLMVLSRTPLICAGHRCRGGAAMPATQDPRCS